MNNLLKIALTIVCYTVSVGASAAPLSVWDSTWTQFASENSTGTGNFKVNPGWGGQAFDVEYLYHKSVGSTLYIGVQTGFDIISGQQTYGSSSKDYYAGDLALSFDGDNSAYEYGVDFGLYTESYTSGNKVDSSLLDLTGIDPAGLYTVNDWNNDIAFPISSPFAIDDGTKIGEIGTGVGSGSNGDSGDNFSYYRWISFDASGLDLSSVDVHWTMSCGNDAIDGNFSSVPEPSLLSLLGIGLLGLGFVRRRKAKA